jgi:hypothetical protein
MHIKLHRIAALAVLSSAAHGYAAQPAPLQDRSAALQCDGRKVELKAACFSYIDEVLACTRQTLTFSDSATGKALNVRTFQAEPKADTDDYPIVVDQFGSLTCVEASNKEKYVVARMDNGGNCARCEWHDVYSHDGVLLGTDRDRKNRSAAVKDAVSSVYDKKTKRVLGQNKLVDFYFQRAKQ